MEKVSVVVAVYNAEQTIVKCLDSLVNQTYENVEIIIVDDCSKDNSNAICSKYSEKNNNIILIKNEVNQGVSQTRNNGIDASSGDFICFVDSDDYVEKDYIEKLYKYTVLYNTLPICGFTYYDLVEKAEPCKYVWSKGNGLVSVGEAFRLNEELYLTALWNKIFNNKKIKEYNIRFDTSLSMGEDLRFSVDYCKRCNISEVYVMTDTLYNYYKISVESLMSNYASENNIKEGFKNLKLIYDLAKDYNQNAKTDYCQAKERLSQCFIYFIMKDKSLKKRDKIKKIKSFSADFSNKQYRSHKIKLLKEKIHKFINFK